MNAAYRLKQSKNLLPWTKVALAVSAVTLLGSASPVPGVIGQIHALGELRVVTRSGPLSFYRGADGTPQGPEYELARRFADELGVRLTITPVRTYGEIYAAIRSGRAHMAAAGLKISSAGIDGIAYGPAYHIVRDHLIYRRGAHRPGSLADIGGSDLEIAAGGPHVVSVVAGRRSTPDLVWVEDASADTQALLDGVAAGRIDYTIADSTEFLIAREAHPELRIAFDFAGNQRVAWAATTRDPEFLLRLDGFFERVNATGELASIVQRYYGRAEELDFDGSHEFMRDLRRRLPMYRRWFEEAAVQVSQDWRLLAAMAYQESKWDPHASSASGAKGMMQLTQESATEAKVGNLSDPRQNIFGGARYFKQVLAKIPVHVTEPDRTWFALAAYNIGYGHVEDARILAERAGRDPNSWQDVREFLPLLSQAYWYTQTENGYARGSEPVRYVDNVRDYRDLLEGVPGSAPSLN